MNKAAIKKSLLGKLPDLDIRTDQCEIIRIYKGDYRAGIEEKGNQYKIIFGSLVKNSLSVETSVEKSFFKLDEALDYVISLFRDVSGSE